MKQYLTVKQVSELLMVEERTVRLWLKRGDLKGIKLGNKLWRVSQLDLSEFVQGGEYCG